MGDSAFLDQQGTVNAFTKGDFSVDEYLSKCGRSIKLETLLGELEEYLHILKSTKIQFINKDYERYILLASKILDINKSISDIEDPLQQMKQEFEVIKGTIGESLDGMGYLVHEHKRILEKKRSYQSIEQVQISLKKISNLVQRIDVRDILSIPNMLLLQRAVMQVCHCDFFVWKCSCSEYSQHMKDYELLKLLVLKRLNTLLLCCIRKKDKNLSLCLSLYLSLNKTEEAYSVVRSDIVAPVMNKLINEESLRNQPAELEGVYDKIINFVDREFKPLIDCTQDFGEASCREFDFMLNSVWPEIDSGLKNNLKCVFVLTDSNLFHKRYLATLKFLNHFEERLRCFERVQKFRALSSYKTFMETWDLPIYFQLRFQEIAGSVEAFVSSEDNNFKPYINNKTQSAQETEWKLAVSAEFWSALNMCWTDGVFIRQLAHRFWKCSMQLLSRYCTWIRNGIHDKCRKLPFKQRIDFLIDIYTDSTNMAQKTTIILVTARKKIDLIPSHVLDNMEKCSIELQQKILSEAESVGESISHSVVAQNTSIVKSVNDIPRLFRRTNREKPSQPSAYVGQLLCNVMYFLKKYPVYFDKWSFSILSGITSQYHEHLNEVLTSVQKTEESLRKLKKIRDPSGSETKENTDDDKIRLQLQIDIRHYIHLVKSITNDPDIAGLKDLIAVLTSLENK